MDLFEELESMAINVVANGEDFGLKPSDEEITRWQTLFNYSFAEAVEQLEDQRNDYTRYRVPDGHWGLVRSEKEAEGYSREAYEHWIKIGGQSVPSHQEKEIVETSVHQAESSYLVLLEDVLSKPEHVQAAANLLEPPETVQAASETGNANFCRINGGIKNSIQNWLSQQKSTFKPTFVRLSKAKKDLSATSIYPSLGLDSTLPQHRLPSSFNTDTGPLQRPDFTNHTACSPLQNEYPVWYFFYGTLADAEFLAQLLLLPDSEYPRLVPAEISGGILRTWQGKYKALVDGDIRDCVHGSAFEVTSAEREEALQLYETEKYEVVRCYIRMAGRNVRGLTFRFVQDK